MTSSKITLSEESIDKVRGKLKAQLDEMHRQMNEEHAKHNKVLADLEWRQTKWELYLLCFSLCTFVLGVVIGVIVTKQVWGL